MIVELLCAPCIDRSVRYTEVAPRRRRSVTRLRKWRIELKNISMPEFACLGTIIDYTANHIPDLLRQLSQPWVTEALGARVPNYVRHR